jgi:hypothetical protein
MAAAGRKDGKRVPVQGWGRTNRRNGLGAFMNPIDLANGFDLA